MLLGQKAVAAATIIFAMSSFVHGGTLGLTSPGSPDLVATGLTASYDYTSQKFSATGSALIMGLDLNGSAPDEFDIVGDYSLMANIDHAGKLGPGSSLEIDAQMIVSLDSSGNPVSVLPLSPTIAIVGTLTNFDFDLSGSGGGTFAFFANIDSIGGSTPPASFPTHLGILLSSTTGTIGSFVFDDAAGFSLDSARADNFVTAVPIPAAAPAGLMLLCGLGYQRLRYQA